MRKFTVILLMSALVSVAGCVTINVYFPAAAAQKAAEQFIGKVIDDQAGQQTPAPSPRQQDEPDNSDTPGHAPGPAAAVLDLLIPAAHAADSVDLKVHTPEVDAIRRSMHQRFRASLKAAFDSGAIGLTNDGMVAVHDASAAPLSQRSGLNALVTAENRDRTQVYQAIAKANGHSDWTSQIRDTFAHEWIRKAHAGWYYQDASGNWKRK